MVLITDCVAQKNPVTNIDMEKYVKEWAEIESLREKKLPKSLLPKVNKIYQSALAEQNYEQVIKAIIYLG